MTLEEKARLVYEHFGEESQREKAKEEWVELSIALLELSKFDIKNKKVEFKEGLEIARNELVYNCNDELADNIFLRMQIEDRTFNETYSMETRFNYCKELLYRDYCLTNFTFDKETVRKIAEEKANRTLQRYGIGGNNGTNTI